MDATVTHRPVKTPAPRWDVNNPAVKATAEDLHRHHVTPAEAYGVVSSLPEYQPVAEALERLTLAGVADSGVEAIIRAASRR